MNAHTMHTLGGFLFWIGLFVWLAETWHFGWNSEPRTKAEAVLDVLTSAMILAGIFLRMTPNPPTP